MAAAAGLTDVDLVLRRFRALGDEKRLRILALLREGERCVCELQDTLGAGQSLLSFHLKMLKDARLVTDRRDGRWVYYALDGEALGDLEQFLREARTAADPAGAPASRRCD